MFCWYKKNIYNLKIFFSCIFLFILFLYVASFFLVPCEWDTDFYPIVGRGIIEYHLLPYDYIFDHKPYFVYIFYYMWSQVEPIFNGRFTLLSLCIITTISSVCYFVYGLNLKKTAIYILIGTVPSGFLIGNTEVIQVLLIFLILVCIDKGVKNKTNLFVIAGLISSISFAINYLSGFIIFSIVFYSFISKSCSVKQFFLYSVSFVLSTCMIYIPFLIHGNEKLINYFSMQNHFLKNYSANFSDRMDNIEFVFLNLSLLYPILVRWFDHDLNNQTKLFKNLISIWFFSSLLASMLSGYSFVHYFALFLVPLMIMYSVMISDGEIFKVGLFVPFFICNSVFMVQGIKNNINNMEIIKMADINHIKKIVGTEKILDINVDPYIYYIGGLETFDKFLFPNQVETYFGDKADNYYMDNMKKNPKFVLIPHNGCNGNIYLDVCNYLFDNYHLVHLTYNHKHPNRYKPGDKYFELYAINQK